MNKLGSATSPYLLQHANNPVDWYPWGPEALQKARDEDKLILVSIGYSACHWCHVMEHESFEDKGVAAVMNEHFVCIKVDREERPDVDHIYMSAVQLITGHGGWPLNCICLPDQRPIYGGTYFKKEDWVSLLFNLADFYKQKPDEAEDYAVKLTEGIRQYESVDFIADQSEYRLADLQLIVENWKKYLDMNEGGTGRAPKFPMPNNWQFLTRYAYLAKDESIALAVKLTLQKMAYGGIYDHIGGGFARYSVDGHWHVPHFEKMLYDNAQLIALYAEAYTWQHNELYHQVVKESVAFIERELTSPEGGFYSALDADSEGVEGKFYTFSKLEIDALLGHDAPVFCAYYHITGEGNWEEEETNVLYRKESDELVAREFNLSLAELRNVLAECRQMVFDYRSRRIRPGLDNKILTSWNGLMLKGLCEAYRAFDEPHYLELALRSADFIKTHLITDAGRITRIYKPGADKNAGQAIAFLDDYANIIDAFIALYEVTFDINWLTEAKALAQQAISHYYNPEGGIFYYTAADDEELIARKSEIMDGVIPSSNSVMAVNLKKLGLFYADNSFEEISAQLLRNMMPYMAKYGSVYSNWANLLLLEVFGTNEIAITGPDAEALRWETEQHYIPNKIMLGGMQENLPLLEHRVSHENRLFVCKNKTCGLPAGTVADALKQIEA